MEIIERNNYKVTVNVPEEYAEELMDRLNDVIDPIYPGYDRTFTLYPVTGTWRPLEGSSPFKGTIGVIEKADEIRLEFVVKGKDVRSAVVMIKSVHPYEEPAIDVTPVICGNDVI